MDRRHVLVACRLFRLATGAAGNYAGGQATAGHVSTVVDLRGPAQIDRTIDVTMSDRMRCSPDHVKGKAGQATRFSVKDAGDQPPEMVIGSSDELKEHAGPNVVRLAAGETGEIVWYFDSSGPMEFACPIPAHLEAGMQGQLIVANGVDHQSLASWIFA